MILISSRKGKKTVGQTFSFMTMADRSPVKRALQKKAASVRDLNESEYRGVMNTAYNDETDGGSKDTENGGTLFMVNNPEFAKHKVDFMKEVGWFIFKSSRSHSHWTAQVQNTRWSRNSANVSCDSEDFCFMLNSLCTNLLS